MPPKRETQRGAGSLGFRTKIRPSVKGPCPPRAGARTHVYSPSLTSMISSATRPWASRWTASAAFLSGASHRQNTVPSSSLNQYLRYRTPYLSCTSRSFLMGSCDRFCRQPLQPLVDVHVQRHVVLTSFRGFFNYSQIGTTYWEKYRKRDHRVATRFGPIPRTLGSSRPKEGQGTALIGRP